MKKKPLRLKTWIVGIACSDCRDDFTVRVRAKTEQEAKEEAYGATRGCVAINGVWPAYKPRKRKKKKT